jgi:hypothetical protein
LSDLFERAFRVRQNVVVPEPQDREALRTKQPVANSVAFVLGVLTSVEFNDKSGVKTYEIDDVFSKRKLPPKRCARK